MGEWCYLPLTRAILTRQAVQSVKKQMRDWNRANRAAAWRALIGALSALEHLFIDWLMHSYPAVHYRHFFRFPCDWYSRGMCGSWSRSLKFLPVRRGQILDTVSVDNHLPIKCLLISLSVVLMHPFCAWSMQIMNICVCIFNGDVLIGHILFEF